MAKKVDRKTFLTSMTAAGLGMNMMASSDPATEIGKMRNGNESRLGIIGLDTSHATAFTNIIHNNQVRIQGSQVESLSAAGNDQGDPRFQGFKVVAAYPYGSETIESSYSRIPGYIEDMKELGVEIVGSIDDLLSKVDYVLLLTNDGHLRLEQSIQVMAAGKIMFMDKPIAGSLADILSIMRASEMYNIPIFSSSSLRYVNHADEVRSGERIGRVLGADTYSRAPREPSHPDLFWYGMHGVEILFSVMRTGCKSVTRKETELSDIVVGVWDNGRVGTFRGIRQGRGGFGGVAYGTEGIQALKLGRGEGYLGIYQGLVADFLQFFRTGTPPIPFRETLEAYAFMEAADESKRQGGASVSIEQVIAMASR